MTDMELPASLSEKDPLYQQLYWASLEILADPANETKDLMPLQYFGTRPVVEAFVDHRRGVSRYTDVDLETY